MVDITCYHFNLATTIKDKSFTHIEKEVSENSPKLSLEVGWGK